MNKKLLAMWTVAAGLAGHAAYAQSQGEIVAFPPVAQTQPAPMPSRGPGMRMRSHGAEAGAVAAAPVPRLDLGKWWKNSKLVQEIGLSSQQVNQIEQSFLEHRLKLIDLNADVQRNEMKLQPLIEADQLDEAKISAQMDLLLAARSRLEKANMMMMISIRKVLTTEQWKKLEDLREERVRMFSATPHPEFEGMLFKQPGPPMPEDEFEMHWEPPCGFVSGKRVEFAPPMVTLFSVNPLHP